MNNTNCDYIILGAGPAGLQLGYFLNKAGRSFTILERGPTAGTFFAKFPRHRKLISVNKVYTGHCDQEINYRWDWNALLCDDERMLFKNYSKKYFPSADDMVHYLCDFAKEQSLDVRCDVDVQSVSRDETGFHLTDQHGVVHHGKRMIVATGVSKPNIPRIEGIECVEQYTEVSVNPDDFINQRVLIIGKGNSAFETADNLIDTAAVIHVASPRPVKFAWQTHFVGHLRAVNNNLLDTYLLKCQNATLEVDISKIEKRGSKFHVSVEYHRASGSRDTIEYDRVICCTGFRFDNDIFEPTCRPNTIINDRFPELDSSWQSVNVPDLYFAGTLTQSRDFKKTTSGFIHGFRYNVRALALMLEAKYEDQPIPYRELAATPAAMARAVIDRINRSSALWQQFGFLCDVLVPEPELGQTRYYEALPLAFAHDQPLAGRDEYYSVTLEYGFHEDDDPFRSKRVAHTDAEQAAKSTFLHPVLRRFSKGKQLDEFHIVENLEANWTDEQLHVAPLERYFASTLPAMVAVQ